MQEVAVAGDTDERPRGRAPRPARRSSPACSPAPTTGPSFESAPHTHVLDSIADLPAVVFPELTQLVSGRFSVARAPLSAPKRVSGRGGGARCRGRGRRRRGPWRRRRPAGARAARRGPARRASAATSVVVHQPALRLERDDAALARAAARYVGVGGHQVALRVGVPRHEPRDPAAEQRRDGRRAGLGVRGRCRRARRIEPTSCTSPASWSSRSSGPALGEQRGALQRVGEQVDVLLVGVLGAAREQRDEVVAGSRQVAGGSAPSRPRRSSTWSTQVEPFSMRSSSSGTPRSVEVVHEVADHVAVAAEHDRRLRLLDELERVRSSPRLRRGSRRSRPRARAVFAEWLDGLRRSACTGS